MGFFTPAIDPSQSQARSRSEISVSCSQNTGKVEWSERKGRQKNKKEAANALPFVDFCSFLQPTHSPRQEANELVGTIGLEPTTPTMSTKCLKFANLLILLVVRWSNWQSLPNFFQQQPNNQKKSLDLPNSFKLLIYNDFFDGTPYKIRTCGLFHVKETL